MATAARKVWTGNRALARFTVPIESLEPHPENPRRHDMAAICASLEAFGQQRPVLVVPAGRIDAEKPTIIAGHGTTAGAAELGWTHVAVLESDLTDAEIERFVLADNRTSDLATYDDELLARLLEQASESEHGLESTGYQRDDLDQLLAEIAWRKKRKAAGDAEAVPEPPGEAKSVVGEVYELGPHRIACGDAADSELVGRLLDGKLARFVMADPPYNVGYTGGATSDARDDSYFDQRKDYPEWLGSILSVGHEHSDAKSALHLWFAMNEIRAISTALELSTWEMRTIILWCKEGRHTGSGFSQYKPDYEPCVYAHKRGKSPRFYGAAATWATVFYPQPRSNDLHPTMKPVDLYRDLMENHTRRGEAVLELFGGSGTTIIAAEQAGRVAYCVELEPRFCDVMRQRYADYIGDPSIAP